MNIHLNIYISNCSHLQVNIYIFIKMKKYLNIQLKKCSNKQLSIYLNVSINIQIRQSTPGTTMQR